MLTAAHVVYDSYAAAELDRVSVLPDPSVGDAAVPASVAARSAPAQGTALWPFPDLALLRLDADLDHPCVLLKADDPVGECHAWGFSTREHGVTPSGSPATFVFEGVDGDGYLRLKAGQAAPGLSGAPLLCPVRRAVVGVVIATRDRDSALGGWASPVTALLTGGTGVPADLAALGARIGRGNRMALDSAQANADWQAVMPDGAAEPRDDELAHVGRLIAIHERNVQVLETQVASFGPLYVPPHKQHELEYERATLAQLRTRLEELRR